MFYPRNQTYVLHVQSYVWRHNVPAGSADCRPFRHNPVRHTIACTITTSQCYITTSQCYITTTTTTTNALCCSCVLLPLSTAQRLKAMAAAGPLALQVAQL